MLSPEWNPGPLDVLHDAGNQDFISVSDGIDFYFLSFDVFIDKDGMIGGDGHRFLQIVFSVHRLHRPPACPGLR